MFPMSFLGSLFLVCVFISYQYILEHSITMVTATISNVSLPPSSQYPDSLVSNVFYFLLLLLY